MMDSLKKYLAFAVIFSAVSLSIARAVDLPILRGSQGGTGIGSGVAGDVGKVLSVQSVGPLVWSLSAAGSGTVTTSTAATAGYFPTWGSASALTGTSTIYMSGLSTGIRTITPTTTLHVVGTFQATGTSTLGNIEAGANRIVIRRWRADTSSGMVMEASDGTEIGTLGASNAADITWAGNHTFTPATASTIAGFNASKVLGSLSTATYPSLTELSYVKGVTSAIQTQLDGKLSAAITSLNSQTGATQTFATSSTGTGFNLTSAGDVHTLRIGTASGSNAGLLTATDWTTFNNKLSAAVVTLNGQTGATQTFATSTGATWTVTSSGNTHTFQLPSAVSFFTNDSGYLTAAITSLNGLSGATQTFASSTTGTNFSITSSGTAHTFNMPSSSSANRGLLTAADWTTFNSKLSAAVVTLNGQTGATQTFATSTSGVDFTVTSSGDAHTFAMPETSSSTRGAVGSDTYKSLAKKRFDFYLENPGSAEDFGLMTFDATSTILSVYAVNKTINDTVTFNLAHNVSRAVATSSAQWVFSSNQTNTATTTPTKYTTFASSTVPTGAVMRLFTTSASSSQFIVTVYYREGT